MVIKYFIDLIFPVHELVVEIDENGPVGRSELKKKKRKTGFEIIRINPEKENFDIDNEISEIQVLIPIQIKS